ncbi:LOW QUALITY PROTEIN: ankyrin repeat and LEM domain-containing protein 1 isoform X1 [Gallus gallus]|uniref:LOW QUALITY PROTEIN: ankyrin repeat and LEM domain-containing protein 1 isoform X1 n=1 Tax=Gallus gallus TaxID=9031 RepID=UPI001F00F282|nr:LOW QUALITY PROTEIN: ankyrin repeat and LEM domain-containing protein 1 isoform X1 [Gallus gallus]
MGCEGGRGGRGVGRCTGEGRALQQPGRCSGGVGFAAGVVALPHGRGGAAVRGDPRVVPPPRRAVEVLLQRGADPNLLLPGGFAPVHLSAAGGAERGVRCLRLLLRYGGDPNARAAEGLTPLHVAASWGSCGCLELLLQNGGDPELRDQDGKRAIDLALEQGHGLCVQLLQDWSLPDPHGARRSLSFLSEDRTDAELLSSTRVSQLDELGLGGSCGLGEPPCCAQPSLGPSPTPRLPGGPALPLQPLASSTLLWAGGECEEVPLKGTGVRCSLQPGAGARSPPQPLRCSGDRGVLEAGTGGHDLPGDSSEDSERFVTAVEMLEPNGAGVCPGEAPSSEELPVLFQGCSLECSPPAPRGSLASRLALLQGMALCRGCSPPSSATSPPAPRAASRPQQQGSALPPPPPPPSSMPAWKSPAGPPGSEHPGVSPGILAPPQDTALPSVVRMCPEGMEKAQCLQMTPRSSPGPPASPAPPWEPAAPAPQCCWLMGITAVPRTLCRVLRDPSALQCCWALGVTATPRTPHQMLGVLPAPRCCRVQGTVTTPRIPHHTFRAPLLPLTPGCRSQGPPRCHAHPLTTAPTAPWNPMCPPTERRSPSAEATGPGDGDRAQSLRVLSDEALLRRLRALGYDPGPITVLTRRVYLRRLEELSRSPAGHSPELADALRTGHIPNCTEDEMVLAQQFDRPDRSRHWREGLLKASFNYLLLDPRTTQDLPLRCHRLSPMECFKTFVDAIFYVGKGTRARPYSHLAEAVTQHRMGTRKGCPKVRRILEIWASGMGVISLHCFQSSVPAEAYTREGCMLEALGLRAVTNQRKGNCYGLAASWSPARRRRMGVHMLHRAMRIFLAEGERQLRPADIQAGR